jgi:hypothetical protein
MKNALSLSHIIRGEKLLLMKDKILLSEPVPGRSTSIAIQELEIAINKIDIPAAIRDNRRSGNIIITTVIKRNTSRYVIFQKKCDAQK